MSQKQIPSCSIMPFMVTDLLIPISELRLMTVKCNTCLGELTVDLLHKLSTGQYGKEQVSVTKYDDVIPAKCPLCGNVIDRHLILGLNTIRDGLVKARDAVNTNSEIANDISAVEFRIRQKRWALV